ncbi:MAG: SLC13 family permease [Paracoccaceae bacterium]
MPVALGAVVVAYVLARILGLEDLYEHIDWPVIVLLASLIPLGMAMDSTGASGLVADLLARATAGLPAWVGLMVLMVSTMFISDVLNNNATAILAAPVGIRLAETTGTNPDAYLMAVAIAASCAFLTPIGHQNNTIVMGPGSYRFSDYWRMGLPLEAIVVAVAMPAIMAFWPL